MRTRNEIIEKARELGLNISPSDKIIRGDFYLAWRNGDPVLLECSWVNEKHGWIVPMQASNGPQQYCFDIWECVKVIK